MLKKLIGTIYLITTSSLSFATGISTMTGDASLSDTTTNWNPAFVDGNTVVVGADNISLTADASVTIGAIRLDHTMSEIQHFVYSNIAPTIGSIAGTGLLNVLQTAGYSPNGQTWTLTGTAGVDNNPPANDYSGLSRIEFTYSSILNINAPVTIDSTFAIINRNGDRKININDNVIITSNSINSLNNPIGSSTLNIAAGKSLTLSGNNINLKLVSFNFSDSGTLILSGDNTIYNPSALSNVSNAILNINNNVTTNMQSVLTINTINIADGKSLTIDAVNSDIDLLDNNASINFGGSGAVLVLTNSGMSDRIFTAYNTLAGDVLFSSDGTLISEKGVDGGITTSTDNTGTITIGSGDVGVIGAEGKSLKLVNLNQTTAASVGKLYATNVNIGGVGPITATDLITSAVSFSSDGSLVADKGITGNIDFDCKTAILTFNGVAGSEWYTLDGTISNAGSTILEVDTKLRVTDKGIGEIKTINIGERGILSIESNEANLVLISVAGGSINFTDEDAQLILSAPQNQTINFAASIEGSDNGGGIILLDGNNLTITLGNDAFLGTEDKRLSAINVSGNVIFDASVGVNASSLNINDGAYLTDYSAAAESIDSINIGNNDGAGEYILDARDEDFSISADNIIFKNEDSVLALRSTSEDEERTITLEASIVPSQDKYGVLTLYSTGDKKLTIDNNGDDTITIGAAATRLKQLILSSDGDAEFDIRPAINVESLGLDLSKIDLGEVDANIIFHKSAQYNANGNINGNIDFAGQDGVINVADNVNINGSVSSTDSTDGTLNFLGSSAIDGVVSNISTMQAGAGDVTFVTSGDYSIGELYQLQ